MSAMKSILLAIGMAERLRDQAIKDLTQVELSVSFAQSQLDQLMHYATDTAARWTVSTQIQITTQLMQHHYQFLDRLHHAISLQQTVMAERVIEVNESKNVLLQAQIRLASLKNILKKRQQEYDYQTHRHEQRQMDEIASTQHSRLRKQSNVGEPL
jgi:flagellar protein FliJ